MAPPPSTPAPHKFLVAKRSGTQRNASPKPLQSGSQQFRTTPRFSLHSTPREPVVSLPLSTPARPATFVRQRQTDSISDVIDSSPPDVQPLRTFSDSIETESVPTSSIVVTTSHESSMEFEEGAPTPKRRRLSVFSEIQDGLDLPLPDEADMIDDSQSIDERSNDAYDTASDSGSGASDAQELGVQQPTFRSAPRFVPVERPAASIRDPLPNIFSPRRRGTRDVPGGLAAEMRNWLLDIEADTGPKPDEDFIGKISVDEVRRGLGMSLIKGRKIMDTTSDHQTNSTSSVRVMLAGEGRLLGLARRNNVSVGSVVAIARPVWEANLGVEGQWAVACDWVML